MDNRPTHSLSPSTPPKHHPAHPGCPNTLSCLSDSDAKPRDTFATIIRCAILTAPNKRMTLNCIYNAIEEKYPYYHDAGPGWKNTVRHVLSTSQQFEKSRRPITEPGKGGYWSVNSSLSKPDNSRNRRSNRASVPKREHIVSEPSPPVWAPAQEQTLQVPGVHVEFVLFDRLAPQQDYSYIRPLHNTPTDPNPDAEPRSFTTQIAPMAPMTTIPHYQDHTQSYNLVHHIQQIPHLTSYASHPNGLMYSYDKSAERPGWLTEVSWGSAPPLGNVAVNGRH